jgi:carbonic anhydrase
MRTITQELQEKISPAEALEILRGGNKRFIQNLKVNRNFLEQVNITRDGQWPFAVVLSCIDSRTSAELIFDQGLGDIFSVRIAGNIINDDILGSMEFACKVAGSKFVLVLGHKKCGAIKGACDGVKLGHLSVLLSKIEPAIQEETTTLKDRNAGNEEFVENVARINVKRVVKEVLNRSSILKEMVDEGSIGIGGAMYDVTTGEVEFYDDTIIMNPAKKASQLTTVSEIAQPGL